MWLAHGKLSYFISQQISLYLTIVFSSKAGGMFSLVVVVRSALLTSISVVNLPLFGRICLVSSPWLLPGEVENFPQFLFFVVWYKEGNLYWSKFRCCHLKVQRRHPPISQESLIYQCFNSELSWVPAPGVMDYCGRKLLPALRKVVYIQISEWSL